MCTLVGWLGSLWADLGVHSPSSVGDEPSRNSCDRGPRTVGPGGPASWMPGPKNDGREKEERPGLESLSLLIHSLLSVPSVSVSRFLDPLARNLRGESYFPPHTPLLKRTEKRPGRNHCDANGHSREGQTRLTSRLIVAPGLSDLPNAATHRERSSRRGKEKERKSRKEREKPWS